MSYDPLFKLPSGVDDIESVFKTARGSTYAHHADMTSTRNRSGTNHKDKSTGVQQRSGKTIYMDPEHVNRVAGIYQNAEMATKFVPVIVDGKPTGQVALQLMEDYGPKKAGSTIMQAPYSTKPAVGMNPVEIWGSESPMGSSGKNIHFGNAITEVHPKPSRLGGKLGVAAALLGGTGAASAGELRQAAGDVAESFLPLGLTPSTLNTGDTEELVKRRKMPPTIDKARGGAIKMPEEYSQGSWKLI
jgi:hypothetical protein